MGTIHTLNLLRHSKICLVMGIMMILITYLGLSLGDNRILASFDTAASVIICLTRRNAAIELAWKTRMGKSFTPVMWLAFYCALLSISLFLVLDVGRTTILLVAGLAAVCYYQFNKILKLK